jgi:four helix bundle protein
MPPRHIYPFEKLRVWEGAHQLLTEVYGMTRGFPRSEIYGLTSQTNRAAISVAANLAEGSSRTNRKDQAYFPQIAYGSLLELAGLLLLAVDLRFISAEGEAKLREQIESVSRQLNALRNKQVSS